MCAGGFMTALGTDLDGATLGCLGLGRLGGRVAARGLAFGMRVVAWSQNLTEERCAEIGVKKVTKEQLFAQSDFVSVHLVQSSRTIGLVGAAELAAMKPSACLINTSRGPIVAGGAGRGSGREHRRRRARHIRAGAAAARPRAAVLPNTVLTPHVGYVTEATYEVFYGDTVANIAAWRAGSEPALTLPDTNLYRVHQVRLTDLPLPHSCCASALCLAWGERRLPQDVNKRSPAKRSLRNLFVAPFNVVVSHRSLSRLHQSGLRHSLWPGRLLGHGDTQQCPGPHAQRLAAVSRGRQGRGGAASGTLSAASSTSTPPTSHWNLSPAMARHRRWPPDLSCDSRQQRCGAAAAALAAGPWLSTLL